MVDWSVIHLAIDFITELTPMRKLEQHIQKCIQEVV